MNPNVQVRYWQNYVETTRKRRGILRSIRYTPLYGFREEYEGLELRAVNRSETSMTRNGNVLLHGKMNVYKDPAPLDCTNYAIATHV